MGHHPSAGEGGQLGSANLSWCGQSRYPQGKPETQTCPRTWYFEVTATMLTKYHRLCFTLACAPACHVAGGGEAAVAAGLRGTSLHGLSRRKVVGVSPLEGPLEPWASDSQGNIRYDAGYRGRMGSDIGVDTHVPKEEEEGAVSKPRLFPQNLLPMPFRC